MPDTSPSWREDLLADVATRCPRSPVTPGDAAEALAAVRTAADQRPRHPGRDTPTASSLGSSETHAFAVAYSAALDLLRSRGRASLLHLLPAAAATHALDSNGANSEGAMTAAAHAYGRLRRSAPSPAGEPAAAGIAATLAAAIARGLPPDGRRRALNIAGCGLVGAVPVSTHTDLAYRCARIAQNAVLYSRYADAGLTAPIQVFEDRRGLRRALAATGAPRMSRSPAALRQAWSTLARFAVSEPWQPRAAVRSAALLTSANAAALAAAAVASEPAIAALGHTYTASDDLDLTLRERATRIGAAAHVMDFDDTHLETLIHPGAPVVGACLALAQHLKASGEQLLASVAVGVEVSLRVGRYMGRPHIDLGWHPTSTMGALGAAAGAARLIGLDTSAAARALAAAAMSATGLLVAAGTGCKALNAGRAAADGLEAALLAERTPDLAAEFNLETYRSALTGLAARPDPDGAELVNGLGSTWLLEENTYKPYACGVLSHAVVDLGREVRNQVGALESTDHIIIGVNPIVLRAMGNPEPRDELEGKFSAPHCFAVGYLDGKAGIAQFSSQRVNAHDTRQLRSVVNLFPDPDTPTDSAWARISTASGQRYIEVAHARGSLDNPLGLGDVKEKITGLLTIVDPEKANQLADDLLNIGTAMSVTDVDALRGLI